MDYMPYNLSDAVPLYTSHSGWMKDISKVKNYEDLPQQTKDYISIIENKTGIKVTLISVSPDREDTIFRK